MKLTNPVFVSIQDTDRIAKMVSWADSNFSPKTWTWSFADDSDLNSDVVFYFSESKDATAFALRWA